MTRNGLPTLLLALAACASLPGGDATLDVAFRTTPPMEHPLGVNLAGRTHAEVTSVVVEVLSIEANVDDSWVVLADAPQFVDLVALEDGTATALNDALVPAGYYGQVRLLLGDENTIVADGETLPLTVPSGARSGIKIPLDADLVADQDYVLDLRFDLDHNLVHDANGWKLTPVLHVVSLDGDDDEEDDDDDDEEDETASE